MVEDLSEGVELVGRTSQRSRSYRRPSWRCETGRETLADFRNWSGDPPGVPEMIEDYPGGVEVIGRPSRRLGSGRETHP